MNRHSVFALVASLTFAAGFPAKAFAQTGGEVALAPISLAMAATSYPVESLARNEEGTVVFDLAIGVDGRVTSAETAASSGYPLLDSLALQVVRNVRLPTPPRAADGSPATGRTRADIVWTLPLQSAEMYMQSDPAGAASGECRNAPAIGRDDRRQRRLSEGEIPIYERYTLVNEQGTIEESLLLTEQGWMRSNAELLAAMNQRAAYGPGSSAPNGPRPSTCWLYEETTR